MEQFVYKGAYKFQGIMSCGYPVIAIGGIGAMYIFVIRDSGGMLDFEHKEFMPLILIGLVGWLIYEIYSLSKRFSFKLRISDDGIQVGDSGFCNWEKITKAKFHGLQFGKDAVITLYSESGGTLEVPAAIDHLQYIQGIIESKVDNIERKE